jgi:signal transduction histidine kinase
MTVPLHLLLIEDSEDDALLLLREVRRGGFDVRHERVDSPGGLAAALDRQPWDLVISDFSMPQFSGTDALGLVRDKGLETPFIFVSGTLGEETAVAALKNGAQDYLVKGNLQRLVPAIQRELRETTARREKKQLEQQVQQLQKFEAIGRLAGGIAHDFNNVLGAILGWAELAFDEAPPGSRLSDSMRKIREQAERAAGLTAQLLAFARRQVLQRKRISLNTLVAETTGLLRTVIAEHIELSIHADPGLRTALADPAQIDQVLMNLCLNARDSMPQGGRLTITTENIELAGEHCHKYAGLPPGSFVLLTVADSGTGMDPETLERIFEPFFTTKEMGKGTGLGLATVYGIIQQHGGMIHCDSQLGHGTTFRVFLPADDGPPEEREARNLTQPRKGTETVLLAEDHDGLRESAQSTLQALGYRVLVASNGAEAVELFRRHADQIHVVILDAVMPILSGPDAYLQMSAIRPDPRVIYTSGYAGDAATLAAIRDSGVPLLQKPYTPAALTHMIGKVLSR